MASNEIEAEDGRMVDVSRITSTLPVGNGMLLALYENEDGTLEEYKVSAPKYHYAKGHL